MLRQHIKILFLRISLCLLSGSEQLLIHEIGDPMPLEIVPLGEVYLDVDRAV